MSSLLFATASAGMNAASSPRLGLNCTKRCAMFLGPLISSGSSPLDVIAYTLPLSSAASPLPACQIEPPWPSGVAHHTPVCCSEAASYRSSQPWNGGVS